MTLEQITRLIWEETLRYNISVKKKSNDLRYFRWCCWDMMTQKKPEHCREMLSWVHYLILNDLPDFDPAERHDHAIGIRTMAGWQLGEHKNDLLKTDPYLIPFAKCPDVIQEWLSGKDRIMLNILKREWKHL